jgi:hypothetical protein
MAIIQSGIARICVRTLDVPERWRGDMTVAVQMLAEASVRVWTPGIEHESLLSGL